MPTYTSKYTGQSTQYKDFYEAAKFGKARFGISRFGSSSFTGGAKQARSYTNKYTAQNNSYVAKYV